MSKQIQIKPGKYENLMPDMSDKEFESLKRSINRDGLKHPIEVTADGVIVDGHHRFKACRQLNIEPDYEIVDEPSPELAIRANLSRRNLKQGEKRDVVKEYLVDNYSGERSQGAIADSLGVSVATVSRAKSQAEEEYEKFSREWFSDSEKKDAVRDYVETNPESDNTQIAENIEPDVSPRTIGNWRDEIDEPATDENDPDEPNTDVEPDSTDEPETPEADDQTDAEPPQLSGESKNRVEQSEKQFEAGESKENQSASKTDSTSGFRTANEAKTQNPSEQVLRSNLAQKNSRIDELESLIRDFIQAVENEDVEAIRLTAERSKELV